MRIIDRQNLAGIAHAHANHRADAAQRADITGKTTRAYAPR